LQNTISRRQRLALASPTMVEPDPSAANPQLTHLDAQGRASMVDVGAKSASQRVAVAEAILRLDPAVAAMLFQGALPKGEAIAVARVAGIQAAKATAQLIPLCHPLPLTRVVLEFAAVGVDGVQIRAECRTVGVTGVEMEAMTAVSVAALTLYDMVKGLCRGAVIERVQLLHKSGGKSGTWSRSATAAQESGPETG
jgi:cyclic pyranopterin phosphate synthase